MKHLRLFLWTQHYQSPWHLWLRLVLNPDVQRFRWRVSGNAARNIR